MSIFPWASDTKSVECVSRLQKGRAGRVHPRRRIHNRLCRKAGFGFLGQGLDCGSNLIPNSDSDMNLSQTLGLPEGGLGTQLVALRLPEQILQRSDGQSLPVN